MSDFNSLTHDYNPLIEKMAMATVMSQSLLYVSGRNYLETLENDCSQFFEASRRTSPQLPPHFIHIAQLGKPVSNDYYQPLFALQTALKACHSDYNQQLIFLVIHDGNYNNIYMGVRHKQRPPHEFMRSFQHFFRGLYGGSQLEYLSPSKKQYKAKIIEPLQEMEYGIAFTGIPSIKQNGNVEHLSCLDHLLKGIQGQPFAYFVIADPVRSFHIDDVTHKCRNLIGQVHALSSINISKSNSRAISNQEGQTISTGTQRTESYSQDPNNSGRLSGLRRLGRAFLPNDFVEEIIALVADPLPNSISTTSLENIAKNISQSVSNSESMQMSIEFINAHVQAAEKLLNQYADRFYSKRALGHWNVGVYCLSVFPKTVELAGTQLQSVLNGSNSMLEPVRWHKLEPFLRESEVLKTLQRLEIPSLVSKLDSDHPFGYLYENLTTPLTTSELSLLINYPRKEIPGIKLIATANFSLNKTVLNEDNITIGNLIDAGTETKLSYSLDINSLAKHALVTGITGSGKTTTCKNILNELTQNKIPFLIIEPAKEEYVEWAMQFNESLPEDSSDRISIYIPGLDSWRGTKLKDRLILNPFDFVWLSEEMNPQVLSHIDRLKSILNGVFPMQEILPILLEDSLYHAYSSPRDWIGEQLPPFDTPRPTLTQLVDQIQTVVKGKGYEPRIAGNLTAALTTRIQSLRRGWKKQLFDQPRSTPWQDIFDRPTVINLSHLGDDNDKAFTMALLFQFLYEYRQAQFDQTASKKRPGNNLRHLTIVEEAHRILLNTNSAIGEQANPQGKVAEMFANILSEIRAYGQGFLLVDQIPARLIPDAVKNTNLKIVHRLVAADDRDAMSACMTLTPEQSAIISRLRAGQAIVCGELDDMAAWVKIAST